jgi:RNA polymerase sigma-70 factor (ECF subfamily)
MPVNDGYDEKLLQLLANGNDDALAEIYRHFWKPLFISSYNILKDKAACEDIIQDIFMQLWLKRRTLTIKESLHAYLHSAARYQVFRYIKNNAGREMLFEGLDERLTGPSPENDLQQKEISEIINTVVNTLPEQCRTIYKMSREQQLSHKEIAEQLHISTKTVENQITIALRKLRSSLGKIASLFFFF